MRLIDALIVSIHVSFICARLGYRSFFGSSSPSEAMSQLLSVPVSTPSLSRFLPLSRMAPRIRLLTSSKFSLPPKVLRALMGKPAELSAPPAELLLLLLFGVGGLDAKKPNPPMLPNDSFDGSRDP
jgi:hypothetical protein